MKFIKNYKNVLLIGAVLTVIGLYYFCFLFISGDVFISHSKNEPERQTILILRNSIQLDDSYEKVLQNFWEKQPKYSKLTLNTNSPELWTIEMPMEIWTTDWRMFIYFQNGKVRSIKIRDSDGAKPKDAPDDIEQITE